jgi:hypothetical protein
MSLKLITSHGFFLINLIEIFRQNFKDELCLNITEEGIGAIHITSNDMRLIKFFINREYLEEYHASEKTTIGINLQQLFTSLKSIKKKELVEIILDNKKLSIYDKKHNVLSSISTYDIQQINIEQMNGYKKYLCINVYEFSRICKELSSSNDEIVIEIYDDKILQVILNTSEISEKIIQVGTGTNKTKLTYRQIFSNDFLNQLGRLIYITTQVKIYYDENLPLFIKCNIGDIGEFEYYAKSKTK